MVNAKVNCGDMLESFRELGLAVILILILYYSTIDRARGVRSGRDARFLS